MPDTFASVSRSLSFLILFLFIYLFWNVQSIVEKMDRKSIIILWSVDTDFPKILVFTERFIHVMFSLNLLPRSQKEKTKMTSDCQVEQ